MATKKFDLRFLLTLGKSAATGEYGTFIARVVYVDDEGRVRHPSGTWSGSLEAPYSDLVVTAQCNRREQDNSWYAVEFGYQDGHHAVDLRRAEVMVKMLRKVQRKLDKLEAEFGHSQELGVVLTRVASALGVQKFALTATYSGDRYGQPYSSDYRWMDAATMLHHLEITHDEVVRGVVR